MRMIFAFIEEKCVYITFFIALLVFKYIVPVSFFKNISNCTGDLISFFAILIGFLLTSLSILITCQDRHFIKVAKTYGGFNKIIFFHKSAIFWGLITCLLSLLQKLGDFLSDWFFAAFVLASCIAVLQTIYYFFKFIGLDIKK